MEHNRKTKVITMVALIVAVLGLSVGLSAYSKTLNIQNVQASVAGNPSNFDVKFTGSADRDTGSYEPFGVAGRVTGTNNKAGSATLNGTTISNLTATFKESGKVYYIFGVYNKGSIPAYLTGITFGNKTCIGGIGTSNELVQAACGDITVTVVVPAKDTSGLVGPSYDSTNNKITDSEAIAPGKGYTAFVWINNSGTHPVDGDFTATIPSITLNYSSQKPSA